MNMQQLDLSNYVDFSSFALLTFVIFLLLKSLMQCMIFNVMPKKFSKNYSNLLLLFCRGQ